MPDNKLFDEFIADHSPEGVIFFGIPITELSREDLLAIVSWSCKYIDNMRKEAQKFRDFLMETEVARDRIHQQRGK